MPVVGYRLRRDRLDYFKERKIRRIRGQQPANAMAMQDGGKVGIKNPFAAKVVGANPGGRQGEARWACNNHVHRWFGGKIIKPLRGLGHRQGWFESPFIRHDVKKFGADHGRKYQCLATVDFRLNSVQ